MEPDRLNSASDATEVARGATNLRAARASSGMSFAAARHHAYTLMRSTVGGGQAAASPAGRETNWCGCGRWLAGSFFVCGFSTVGLIGAHLVPACRGRGRPFSRTSHPSCRGCPAAGGRSHQNLTKERPLQLAGPQSSRRHRPSLQYHQCVVLHAPPFVLRACVVPPRCNSRYLVAGDHVLPPSGSEFK